MHQNTRARPTDSKQTKLAIVLKETKEWYGPRYKVLTKFIVDSLKANVPLKQIYKDIRGAMGISGVTGYWPVRAVVRDGYIQFHKKH